MVTWLLPYSVSTIPFCISEKLPVYFSDFFLGEIQIILNPNPRWTSPLHQSVPIFQLGAEFIARSLMYPRKGKSRGSWAIFYGIAVNHTLQIDLASHSVASWTRCSIPASRPLSIDQSVVSDYQLNMILSPHFNFPIFFFSFSYWNQVMSFTFFQGISTLNSPCFMRYSQEIMIVLTNEKGG